jgi:dihydroorotase
MKILIKNTFVYGYGDADILIADGIITKIEKGIDCPDADKIYALYNCSVFPGFTDVHVHLREPGFEYKETILTGTKAAAAGGYTTVFSMPNLKPVPDSMTNLKLQLDAIDKDAVINVIPYGSLTKGQMGEEISDMDDMAEYVCGFTDDGRGVQSEEMMRLCMTKAKSLGKIISAHCEDEALLNGGYIHDGEYARLNSHKGICSESEWGPVKRDIELLKETKAMYHVCHVSAKETVELVREAKKDGIDITCETGPHYLVFNDMDLKEDGGFKMNPPIRSESDRLALIDGIKDGTLDMIATDHAPHSIEEKSKGLKSLNGIVGLETAFPVLYTELVLKGIITLDKLIELMSINPAKRFGVDTSLKVGAGANLTVFNLNEEYAINSADFLSMGKSTPFENRKVNARCYLTICNGNVAYER